MDRRQVRAPRGVRRLGRALPPRGDEFVSIEVLSGLALVATAIAALAWANIDAESYASTWGADLGPLTAQAWVNEALMAAFFFVVGLEIKRELVEGALRTPPRAALPVFAALGGMVVPALVYMAWNTGGDGARGWGIPMATDIAFALGLLALLGTRVKPGAKAFLLALAIVDDIGAIIVIAVFYSEDVAFVWLLGALGVCAAVVLMRRFGLRHPGAYLVPGIALWLCVHEAGIHATIAGVVLAFARALGEFGATLMFAGNIPGRTNTMPLEIFAAYQAGEDSRALLDVAVLSLVSCIVVFLAGRLSPRSAGV